MTAFSHHCPVCGGPAQIRESRLASNGTRRRRLACISPSCGHRWSFWDGPRPPKIAGALGAKKRGTHGGRQPNQRLNEEHVRLILTRTDLNHKAAAEATGVTHEAVRQIRLGNLHRRTLPELPRWNVTTAITCESCRFWSGDACGMGLPDPEEEGLGFAADCALFNPAASADP